jgi:hypothetical protein
MRAMALAGAISVVVFLAAGSPWAAEPSIMDCLTANETALKLSQDHKLLAEREQLLICAAESCPSEVRRECAARIEEVNSAIPTVVFEVKDANGRDVSRVRVLVDGELLAERLDGTALAIDPGEHVFTFGVSGNRVIEMRLLIRESHKERRERVVVERLEPSKVEVQERTREHPRAVAREKSGMGTQRILALISGSIGIVGVGVGTYFGVRTMSEKTTAEEACPDRCRTQGDADLWDKARTSGNISTVAFLVGGAGLVGAASLWLTDKPKAATSARVSLGIGGVTLKGSW